MLEEKATKTKDWHETKNKVGVLKKAVRVDYMRAHERVGVY